MMLNNINLEDKLFYRLVKVIYVVALGISFFIIFSLASDLKPYTITDGYITCPDGKKYSFDDLKLYPPRNKYFTFTNYDVAQVISKCHELDPVLVDDKPVTDPELLKFLNSHNHNDNYWKKSDGDPYPTHRVTKTIGSWKDAITYFFSTLLLAFLIINGTKQALIYIVYGKKVTLGWKKQA